MAEAPAEPLDEDDRQKEAELDEEIAALDAIIAEEARLDAKQQQNLASTTTAVAVVVTEKAARGTKRKANESQTVLLPPRPDKLGNRRVEGELVRWTYDCSHTLLQTLVNLTRFFEFCPLSFRATGLEVSVTDANNVMQVLLSVPRASFVAYDDIDPMQPIEVTLISKALKNLTRSCSERRTISFLHDRSGDPDAELHVQLFPRFEQFKDQSSTLASYKPSIVELDDNVIEAATQYRVTLSRSEFIEKVRDVATDVSAISLVIGDACFEFASISSAGTSLLVHSIKALEITENDRPADKREECIVDALARGMCVVERRVDAPPNINIAHMRGFRLSAKYTRSAALVAALPACSRVSIDLGVQPLPGTQDRYTEVPVCFTYFMRLGEPGEFVVKTWIAPRDTDSD